MSELPTYLIFFLSYIQPNDAVIRLINDDISIVCVHINIFSDSSLCPIATVELAVADGLGDVVRLHFLGVFKVGDGAGDF